MEDVIIILFIICTLIFLAVALVVTIKDLISNNFYKKVYFDKEFNYSKIDNIYEEFIDINKNDYKKIDYQVKYSFIITALLIIIIPLLFYFEFNCACSKCMLVVFGIIIVLSLGALLYLLGIYIPLILDIKNLKFKEGLIKYMVNECLPNFKYDPDDSIDMSIYEKSKFYEEFDVYFSEDYMKGKIDDTKVKIAEVETLRKFDGIDNPLCMFHGLFVHMKLDKNTKQDLIITTKDEQIVNRTTTVSGNDSFDNSYNIYSKDTKQFKLFDEALLKKLTSLYNDFGVSLDIKIKKEEVFLRFHTGALFDTLIFTREEKNKVYLFATICDLIKEINESIMNKE